MKYTLAISFLCLFSVVMCDAQTSQMKTENPVSDLGHIDLILDSATYFSIKSNAFIKEEFGIVEVDTMYYGGKPSYDLYVLGKLNFLHLSLAKGFWNNQQGGGVMVFQTRKPSMKDPLLHSWKQFYADSLFVHTYKGSDFTLDEVMAWYSSDPSKQKDPYIFANLSTYSAQTYENWGITDSFVNAGLSMNQFMAGWGGPALKNRLFHSITELHMVINQKELKEIRSALLATGYQEGKNKYTHAHNPTIYMKESEQKGKSKYSKVKFKLNNSVPVRKIIFSPKATMKLSGAEGWLLLK